MQLIVLVFAWAAADAEDVVSDAYQRGALPILFPFLSFSFLFFSFLSFPFLSFSFLFFSSLFGGVGGGLAVCFAVYLPIFTCKNAFAHAMGAKVCAHLLLPQLANFFPLPTQSSKGDQVAEVHLIFPSPSWQPLLLSYANYCM